MMSQVVYDVLILFNDGTQTVIRKAKSFEWVAGAELAFITTETGYRMYFNTRNIKMMAREYDCLEYMVNPRAEIERKPEPANRYSARLDYHASSASLFAETEGR